MRNYYHQQGGQQNQEMQIMQQIVQVFQQLSPQAQQQLLQALAQIVQGGGQEDQPQEGQEPDGDEQMQAQAMMRMGGFRPRKNNQSKMYR